MKLKLEDLAVESFEIVGAAPRGGTVHGHDSGENTETTCWGDSSICTQNPADAECVVSREYCSEINPCFYTRDYTCSCQVEQCG